jgi:hypothetical protein
MSSTSSAWKLKNAAISSVAHPGILTLGEIRVRDAKKLTITRE